MNAAAAAAVSDHDDKTVSNCLVRLPLVWRRMNFDCHFTKLGPQSKQEAGAPDGQRQKGRQKVSLSTEYAAAGQSGGGGGGGSGGGHVSPPSDLRTHSLGAGIL